MSPGREAALSGGHEPVALVSPPADVPRVTSPARVMPHDRVAPPPGRLSYDETLDWLAALDGVPQDPRFHPEGDALFHSLQVFEHALRDAADAELLAAALLHDVGKAFAGRDHDRVGAALLIGLPERTVWLVAHHLDLLRDPRRTRARMAGGAALVDLERLRRWDLAGRDPRARVREPEEAVSIVLEAFAGGHV